MPLNLPTYQTIVDRNRSDLKRFLEDLDPTIYASLIRAIVDSNSGRHYDSTLSINQLAKELFPDTASLDYLTRWAAYEGLTPFSEEQSEGYYVATGTAGSIIPAGRKVSTQDGNNYNVNLAATIANNSISITSLTRVGSIVTAVTSEPHKFASNMEVNITGATPIDYNGTYTIIATAENEFTYTISATPTTPATGTILADADCAYVYITSDESGQVQNLDSGAQLDLTTLEAGVDQTGYVAVLGVLGGRDTETKASLLNRTVQSRANPVANFNVSAITLAALSIQGVTRVKVKRITPDIGDVTILFVRDGDANIIPSVSEAAEVKAAIVDIMPANSSESDIHVPTVTAVETNYDFLVISPSTVTMRAAIEANIKAFYQDEVDFETSISEDQYRAAIIDTIDPDTGEKLSSFTLNNPTTDITVGDDSIGTPGDITF